MFLGHLAVGRMGFSPALENAMGSTVGSLYMLNFARPPLLQGDCLEWTMSVLIDPFTLTDSNPEQD